MVYAPNIARKRSRRPYSMRGTLRALYYTQHAQCSYCQRKTAIPSMLPGLKHGLTATVDHLIPISKGGAVRGDNCVLACALCNNLKADMMPERWRAFMLANPYWWIKNELKVSKKFATLSPGTIPTKVPARYDDPKAQSAFERVYRDRLWMLRTPLACGELSPNVTKAAPMCDIKRMKNPMKSMKPPPSFDILGGDV